MEKYSFDKNSFNLGRDYLTFGCFIFIITLIFSIGLVLDYIQKFELSFYGKYFRNSLNHDVNTLHDIRCKGNIIRVPIM